MEIIQTKSFQIACNLTGSKDADTLAICMPGRLDSKDYANFVSHAEYLAMKGVFVVAMDPPGTWDSPGGLELYTPTNYLDSVSELIIHFGNRPTLLLGHSRGGATAMLVAAANNSVQWLVVVNSSYGNPTPPKPGDAENGYLIEHRDLPPGDTRTAEQKIYDLPMAYFEDAAQYDPRAALYGINVPKLVFHGTKDEFQEFAVVEEIFAGISEPKMFHPLEVAHDYRLNRRVVEEVNNIIGEFLEKYPLP
jgi:pimeloyl-ACP methyl ester carboxylesterase